MPVGGVSGLVYHWIAGLRASQGQSAVQPGRLQQISVTVIGVLQFVFMAALSRNIVNFLTIQQGTTTTSLGMETVGVRWSAAEQLATGAAAAPEIAAAGVAPPAVVFLGVESDVPEVLFSQQSAGGEWSEFLNVSNGLASLESWPQIALDSRGNLHLVWMAEAPGSPGLGEIYYSRCQAGACTPPARISNLAQSDCTPTVPGRPVKNTLPAIAIDSVGTLMVAWSTKIQKVKWTGDTSVEKE